MNTISHSFVYLRVIYSHTCFNICIVYIIDLCHRMFFFNFVPKISFKHVFYHIFSNGIQFRFHRTGDGTIFHNQACYVYCIHMSSLQSTVWDHLLQNMYLMFAFHINRYTRFQKQWLSNLILDLNAASRTNILHIILFIYDLLFPWSFIHSSHSINKRFASRQLVSAWDELWKFLLEKEHVR